MNKNMSKFYVKTKNNCLKKEYRLVESMQKFSEIN